MFEQYCHRAGFEPDVAFELEDIGVCEPLVAAGECIALMPALFVSRPHPQVAIRPLRDGPPARENMAIWIPARRVAAIEPLAEALRAATRHPLSTSAGYRPHRSGRDPTRAEVGMSPLLLSRGAPRLLGRLRKRS